MNRDKYKCNYCCGSDGDGCTVRIGSKLGAPNCCVGDGSPVLCEWEQVEGVKYSDIFCAVRSIYNGKETEEIAKKVWNVIWEKEGR